MELPMFAIACLLALSAAWIIRTRRFRIGLLTVVLMGSAGLLTARFQPALFASETAQPPAAMDPAIAAEAGRLGPATDALLARVSDSITYEIYPGVFRGASATLADGAGNDSDKALLLRDLIRASNAKATLRFATCTLPGPQIDALIAAAKSAYRPPRVLAALAARAAAQAKTAKSRAFMEHVGAVWTGVGAQNHDESARLYAALQAAHAPLKTTSAGDLRAAVVHHTWLQQMNGSTWQDLDATLPHAKAGAALCAAESTAADLPSAAFDAVTVRVRVERRQQGKLDDRTAVEGTWRTSDLARAALTFAFAESAELPVSPTPHAAPAGFIAYTPVLVTGDKTIAGAPVLVPDLVKSAGAGMAGLGGGIASVFGQPAPPAAPAPSADVPDAVAMWLQVTVQAPDTPPETVESPVFDRIGYADRVAGRAATATLAKLDDGKGMYLPFGALWNVGVTIGTATAGVGDGVFHGVSKDSAGVIGAIASAHRTYSPLRRAIFAQTNGAPGAAIVNVRPGVSLFGIVWRPNSASPASPVPSLVMDVASDHALPDGATPETAVQWGTSALLAERYATAAQLMLSAVAKGGNVGEVANGDVVGVFAAARRAAVPSMLVRTDRDIASSVPPDVKTRLAQALSNGRVALAPAKPVVIDNEAEYGWWLVGPDGSVRDEMQNGRHQEVAEYTGPTANAARSAPRIRLVGCVVTMAFVAASALATVTSSGHESFEAGDQTADLMETGTEIEEKQNQFDEAGETCQMLSGGDLPAPQR
jgi:hypothetical protein